MERWIAAVILLAGITWAILFHPLFTCIFSLLIIGYVYLGYPLLLGFFGTWEKKPIVFEPSDWPKISVIVAAYNEEKNIVKRIHNILASEYPPDKIEILIGSDGSRDGTVVEARTVTDDRVRVLSFSANRGRASVHNDCAEEATGEILVFSDAETDFTSDFLPRIVAPFSDPEVGLATGIMDLLNKDESGLAESRGWYWRFEYRLRDLETRMGLLSVASGCCMAIRRVLYQPMPLTTDDIDFICPLDVIGQGYRCVQLPKAIVHERQFACERGEFHSRVRMTSRNIYGTWMRLMQYSFMRYSGLWFSVVSHKFLRWLTPFFLIIAYVCTWADQSTFFMRGAFGLQTVCYTVAALGLLLRFWNYDIRPLSSFHSFTIANAGFFVGTIKGIWGTRQSSYCRQNEMKDIYFWEFSNPDK